MPVGENIGEADQIQPMRRGSGELVGKIKRGRGNLVEGLFLSGASSGKIEREAKGGLREAVP